MRKSFSLLLLALLLTALLSTSVSAQEKTTVLYVPLDNRPVSLAYPTEMGEAAQIQMLLPPLNLIGGFKHEGSPEQLWDWVFANANQADALVLSADSLLYGGLVESRTHDYGPYMLGDRVDKFRQLKKQFPYKPLYVFSTVMRSPRASRAPFEPPYYASYGPQIFTYTALADKQEVKGLSASEEKELNTARRAIPDFALQDWMKRRQTNFQMNAKLIKLVQDGVLQYLILGRDDTAPFSQSHKEMRELNKLAASLSEETFSSFPGADHLSTILLARVYNKAHQIVPKVAVHYSLGPEAATVPRYEDQPFGETIRGHIVAAGGILALPGEKPNLVLAVNTPLTPITEESGTFDNQFPVIVDSTISFVNFIRTNVTQHQPIAICDVAYANGADNSLLAAMEKQHLLDKITAYSGWNTASNSLGYAIGGGLLSPSFSEQDRKHLLAVRYLDDWGWQANARAQVSKEMSSSHGSAFSNWNQPGAKQEQSAQLLLQDFARQHLWIFPYSVNVTFPWQRLFEVKVDINDKVRFDQ